MVLVSAPFSSLFLSGPHSCPITGIFGHLLIWLMCQVNFGIPFTIYSEHVQQPLYAAIIKKLHSNFVRIKLYCIKLSRSWKLLPKNSASVPMLVTDATLKVEILSHITGKLSSHHFAGPRAMHIQELLMASVAVSLIKPQSLIRDSTFVCWKYLRFLPWRFALWARQTLSQVKVYCTPSKFNPADGSTCGRPSDWTALTCFLLRQPLQLL